jgi:hypothetical protein
VVVEGRQGGDWTEIARLPPPPSPTIMVPVRVRLATVPDEVRVRVIDHAAARESYLLVDALTFVED